MLSDLRFRLRALFDRSGMERELEVELRFHLERETEKHVRAGVPRAEAERLARVAFGGMSRIQDDTRDSRGIATLDRLAQDLRYAWRGLRSRPGFTAAVVVTLGLGIGANTAMFGVLDRLLFRPPTYLEASDRVHRLYVGWTTSDGTERVERTLEYTRFVDFAKWTTSFDRMAAVAYRQLAIGTGIEAREMTVGVASASFFQLFTLHPALGRFVVLDEDRTPSGAHVAVLGYGLWQSRYGGRSDVIGKSISIGDAIYTIVGVAPKDFVGITDGPTPAAFVPMTTFAFGRNRAEYYQNYHWGWLEVFARRKPGVSLPTADADLSSAYRRSWNTQRQTEPLSADSVARPRAFAGPVQLSRGPEASRDSRIVTWVMGVAIIVLLVACANVANLLLTRAITRRREIALRIALGVSRSRLIQQLLTESVMLTALGGLTGLAFAQWGGRALRAIFLRAEDAGAVVSDGRTVAFVATLTLGVALTTGLAPVLHALRDDIAGSLKEGARDGTHRRSTLRPMLLLFQGALSVVLLVGAGLFLRSLQNVRTWRLGYDVEPIAYAEANMRGVRLTDAEQNALNDRLLAAAIATPGVISATLTVSVPFWSNEGRGAPYVPGRDSTHKLGRFLLQAGSPAYFETVGTRILRGRGFTASDRQGAPKVAVVSQRMANVLWPGMDAIGQQFRIGSDTSSFTTVVGIAEDIRGRNLTDEREFWYYVPITQYGVGYPSVFARVNGRAEDHVEALRRRLQQEMPGAGYVNVIPLGNLVAPTRRAWQFGATMFVAFGVLALVLAAIGLYSVVAFAVAQRTHELGVRIALGAGVTDVLRMIVGQGVAFAAAGIATGSVVAFWAGKWVEPLLFSQSARDPLIYLAVAVVLLVVAIVATVRPALRATRVDPAVALRAD